MARTSRRGTDDNRLVGELVASPQRREVLQHLVDSDGTATFDDVVDVLAGEEERAMTAVRLHHVHLPKLQAAGAVKWDAETALVELTPQARMTIDSVAGTEPFVDLAGD